jgi:hypothetical protein
VQQLTQRGWAEEKAAEEAIMIKKLADEKAVQIAE